MNKTELIAAVASKCSISKKEAEAVVLATFDSITNALVSGCLLYTSPSPRDRG